MKELGRVAVCVFAKPPRPGRAKTRLAVHLGAEAAAGLARAFLTDTWHAVCALPWAQPVLAVTEASEDLLALAGDAPVWLQGEGDLGAKMGGIAAEALRQGFACVILLGADTPGLPAGHLHVLFERLRTHDAVMGPSDDGGFYALGLRRTEADLLATLPWSAPETAARTRARLLERGFSLAEAPPWFDVDEPGDLHRLQRMLREGHVHAPCTQAALESLGG